MDTETVSDRLNREAPLTDIHAHPSLKAWLFGQDLWEHPFSPSSYFPLCCRSDFEALERGGVGVLWASHTVPEIEMLQRSFLTRWGARFSGLYDKLTSGSELDRLFEMMDLLEREVGRGLEKVGIARSLDDVKSLREENKIAIINAVEGGNVLGGDPENLDELADRGVACFTLAHLCTDDIVATADPIPDYPFVGKILSFESSRDDKPCLTELGESILSRLEGLDMILDVAHCAPEARNRIFGFLDDSVPIIASHQGVNKFNPDPRNLSDDEILEIARRDGGIGLMFCSYWLDSNNPSDGLNALWKNIKHIQEVTGSWDHIMLGTDFDGFTNPLNDISDASKLGNVTKMLLEKNLPERVVKKIIGGNAMRILENTWA